MEKKLILHIIDSLALGGAEILLKNVVNSLGEYRHVVLYLQPLNLLENDFDSDVEFICLHHKSWKGLWTTVRRTRRIIIEKKPDLVHSNLFIATLCARLATPANIPLVSSLHSIYSIDAFQKNSLSLWMERATLKKRHNIIAVSNFVLRDYLEYVPFKGQQFVLYNFLPDSFFERSNRSINESTLQCVAVGNLNGAKNYKYLLNVFSQLSNRFITLDIYGDGPLEKELQALINEKDLPVRLCGKTNNIKTILKNYDLFIQASAHEGFGLSVIEAMARGVPVFLSDIPVFREITQDNAHFFPLGDASHSAALLEELHTDAKKRIQFIPSAYQWSLKQYNAQAYKSNLLQIYNQITICP